MFFKDGFIYKARIKFMVDPSGKYDTDYISRTTTTTSTAAASAPQLTECRPRSSAALLTSSTLRYPCLLETGGKGSMRDLAQSSPTDYELNKDSYRASQKRIQSPRPMLLARM